MSRVKIASGTVRGVIIALHPVRNERLRNAGIVAGVSVAHLLLFALMARGDGVTPPTVPPPFEVQLIRPEPPPPPPPPPAEPAERAGGGAPAAPSRIHVPPPPKVAPELPAPPVPAPEPAIVVGVAPTESPIAGMGQGGEGSGTGAGMGSGAGPGSGGTRARLVQGPTPTQILREYPRGARAERLSGRAVIACVIRLDTRLERCRVVDEVPAGSGFGQAALTVSTHFRFQPPTRDGRPLAGQEVTVGVDFGPDAPGVRRP